MMTASIRALACACAVLLSIDGANADPVTIVWDPNPEPDIVGYTLFRGHAPGQLTISIDVGQQTEWSFSDLESDRTHYFAVQARNADGLASPFSELASIFIPAPKTRLPDVPEPGTYDLIWQDQREGWLAAWRMNDRSLVTNGYLSPDRVTNTTWKIVAAADFNGDGHRDLIWQDDREGWLAAWFMQGTTLITNEYLQPRQVVDTNWKVVAATDFNGDGKPDLLWHDQKEGWLALWYMDGLRLITNEYLEPRRVVDTNWKVAAVADFNGDGQPDLLWHDQKEGWLAVWYMQGRQMITNAYLEPKRVSQTNWQIAGTADLNLDGKPDLIWRDRREGWLAVWYMDGVKLLTNEYLQPPRVKDTEWRIVGQR